MFRTLNQWAWLADTGLMGGIFSSWNKLFLKSFNLNRHDLTTRYSTSTWTALPGGFLSPIGWLMTAPYHAGDCTISCWRLHHIMLEIAPYHAGDCTISCWRLHRIMLETAPYHAGDCTISCWRLHRIMLETTPYHAGDCTISCWRLHRIMLKTSPYHAEDCTIPCWRRKKQLQKVESHVVTENSHMVY